MYAFILEQGTKIRSQVATQEGTNAGLKHGQSRLSASITHIKVHESLLCGFKIT